MDGPQVHQQVRSCGVALGRVVGQHLAKNASQVRWNYDVKRWGVLMQNPFLRGGGGGGPEGVPSTERFVEHDTERKDIGAPVRTR